MEIVNGYTKTKRDENYCKDIFENLKEIFETIDKKGDIVIGTHKKINEDTAKLMGEKFKWEMIYRLIQKKTIYDVISTTQ